MEFWASGFWATGFWATDFWAGVVETPDAVTPRRVFRGHRRGIRVFRSN